MGLKESGRKKLKRVSRVNPEEFGHKEELRNGKEPGGGESRVDFF